MGLKAGWLALMVFVWIIGAFLGSTFDYQAAPTAQGQTATGTATFTGTATPPISDVVVRVAGDAWVVGMEDGNIQATADDIWCKIKHVGAGYLASGSTVARYPPLPSGIATGSPITLPVGAANVITVTRLGTLTVVLGTGNVGVATTIGGCTVVGSPFALAAGVNTIEVIGAVGTININTVGSTTQIFLYAEYTGVGGAGLDYVMQPTPGWAGTGGGGYATSPTNKLEYLLDIGNAFQRLSLLGNIPLPVPNVEYFTTAFEVVTWQWSFMEGYTMIYWIFFAPFIMMGVLSMILLVYGILTGNLSW